MSADKENSAPPHVFKTPLRSSAVKRSVASSDSGSATPCTPVNKRLKSLNIPASPFLERLGYGTGVSVFLMNRPQTPSGLLKSPWAVKKLNKKLNNDKSEVKTFEERLEFEADILKSMSHENIVGYRDTIRSADGSLCLCMESGEKSLADLIEQRRDEGIGPFEPSQIHRVVYCISKALSYLHNTKKLLHGDIKSHNVLVKGDFEEIKLCDFGVCLKLRDDLQGLLDEDDCYVGTGAWSSREALEGEIITDRADIYSLGCVIYEMLTLSIPHMPPLSMYGEDNSMLEQTFNEDEFLDAQGSTPVLPDHIHYEKSYYSYIALMSICCREEAELRPAAQQIVTTLEVLNKQLSPTSVSEQGSTSTAD